MATALKSTSVTNADNILSGLASVFNDKHTIGGYMKTISETIEISTAQNINSQIRMCRVHSSWVIVRINVLCDAIATIAPNIGLYYTLEDGSAVLDADAYASGFVMSSALVAGNRNDRYESLSNAGDIANINNRVWQDALLTSDPNKWFDVVFTSAGTPGGAGTLSFRIIYTDGN